MSKALALDRAAVLGQCSHGHRSVKRRLHSAPYACKPTSYARHQGLLRATAIAEEETSTSGAEEFTQQIVDDESKYIVQTYVRPSNIVFTHGEGCRLWDAYGKEYLDFSSGIAVNALGHSDPRWVEALTEQANTLGHTSNLFHTIPAVQLAKRLVELSFADRVFFANTGTEANEAALKFVRKWARVQAGVDPYDPAAEAPSELVSFSAAFHGRTMGALGLTANAKYKTPFGPLLPGLVSAPYQDLEAARSVIKKGRTAGVFVEPLQGEGGVNAAHAEFLTGLRRLCDEAGALLVFDEIQCGLGRTGRLWGYEHYGVEPDIMTLAKPLAGGLPIGAVLVKEHVAAAMKPGDHGSTFAGNPLVCRVAQTVLDVIAEPAFLRDVEAKGERLRAGLARALGGNAHVKEIRGMGLICGVQLDQAASPVVTAARDAGLIVITAGAGDVIRILPPLTASEEEIDEAVEILGRVAGQVLA